MAIPAAVLSVLVTANTGGVAASLTTLDLILIALGAWLLLAALLALAIGAFIRGPQPFEDHGRERLGILEADRAKRREQVERAVARHRIAESEKQRREAA